MKNEERRIKDRSHHPIGSQWAGLGEIAKWPIEFRSLHRDVHPSRVQVGFEPFLVLLPRRLRLPLPFTVCTKEGFRSRECHRSDISGAGCPRTWWWGTLTARHHTGVTCAVWKSLPKDWLCLGDVNCPLTPQWCHHSTRTAVTDAGLMPSTVKFWVRPASWRRGHTLACAKAASLPRRLHSSARAALFRRFFLACSTAKAVASSLLGWGVLQTLGTGAFTNEVLVDTKREL